RGARGARGACPLGACPLGACPLGACPLGPYSMGALVVVVVGALGMTMRAMCSSLRGVPRGFGLCPWGLAAGRPTAVHRMCHGPKSCKYPFLLGGARSVGGTVPRNKVRSAA